MKTQQKLITEYILEPHEIGIVKQCLVYANHRKKYHNKCAFIDEERLSKLLKEMNYVKKI